MDDLAEDFDAQRSTAPYDKVLDVLLRSRGWWSHRREVELQDKDFVFDSWMWGPYLDEVLIQSVGNGEFGAQWNERSASGTVRPRSELLENRQAVIAREFEGLRNRADPR
jgi:hypothetical protein